VTGELSLRRAKLSDAGLLLEWRNDPLTRRMSRNREAIDPAAHTSWLEALLRDPARQLYVAELGGIPVGTVRADLDQGVWELSWTVAPSHRARGIGARMLAALADLIDDPIRAEVKAGNAASIRIAERAGMRIASRSSEAVHLSRPARRRK